MKHIFLLLCLYSTQALAAKSFKIDDPSILGRYQLAKKDKSAEIQSVELIVNSESKLVVSMDRGAGEYEVTAPDKDGVIHSSTDEFNCGGEEETCSYDASTIIKLSSAKNSQGKVIPQLSIEITTAYAWSSGCGGTDENGDDQPACDDDVNTYILNWEKALPYNISFYTDIEAPEELAEIQAHCSQTLEKVVFDPKGGGYLSENYICGNVTSSFKYRDTFETAFPYILNTWIGGNEKQPVEITAQELSDLYTQAKNLAKTYKAPGPVTSQMIIDELTQIENYLLKSDRYFAVPRMDKSYDDVTLFVADTKNQIVTTLRVKIQ